MQDDTRDAGKPPHRSALGLTFKGREGQKDYWEILDLLFTEQELENLLGDIHGTPVTDRTFYRDRLAKHPDGQWIVGVIRGSDGNDPQIAEFAAMAPEKGEATCLALMPVFPGSVTTVVPVDRKATGPCFGEMAFRRSDGETGWLEMLMPFYFNDTAWFKNGEETAVSLAAVAVSLEVTGGEPARLKEGDTSGQGTVPSVQEIRDKTADGFTGFAWDTDPAGEARACEESSSYVWACGGVAGVEEITLAGKKIHRMAMGFGLGPDGRVNPLTVYFAPEKANRIPVRGDTVSVRMLLTGLLVNPEPPAEEHVLLDTGFLYEVDKKTGEERPLRLIVSRQRDKMDISERVLPLMELQEEIGRRSV